MITSIVHSGRYDHWETAIGPETETVCAPTPAVGVAGIAVAAGVVAESAVPTLAAVARLADHPIPVVAATAEVAPNHSAVAEPPDSTLAVAGTAVVEVAGAA